MEEIKPKMINGEPVCHGDCPQMGANNQCLSRSLGCYLTKVSPNYYTPCVPGLRQQRDAARGNAMVIDVPIPYSLADEK